MAKCALPLSSGIELRCVLAKCALPLSSGIELWPRTFPVCSCSVSVPAGSDPAGRIGWQLSVKGTSDIKIRQRKDRK